MMKTETIEITSVAYGGDGIGRLSDGRVCFIPGVLPGEKAEVRITAEKPRFTRGQAVKISSASPRRIEAVCPLYGKCPGCAYMHCDYAFEVECKNRQLQDFLIRSKLADPEVFAEPFASPGSLFYRNKLVLHGDECGHGYVAADNESIIPVAKCFLADEQINGLLPSATGKRVLFRKSSGGKAQIIDPENPGVLRENLAGAGEFAVAGNGFFQTNMAVAAELVKEVKMAVKDAGCRELLELYCGVGVFSIALAQEDLQLKCTGIELDRRAIDFARQNAAAHQVADRCRFFAGDAAKALKRFRKHSDLTVLVDPPRGGMEKTALQALTGIGASRIIYISCAADTLTRDLQKFAACGYRVKRVRLLDMFPRTAHFEVFCVLQKI